MTHSLKAPKFSTQEIGSISELQAALSAIKSNYIVSKPVTVEAFDYILLDKATGKVLKAQVKTLYQRKDNHYYVLYAKKGRKKRYTTEEVDVFLAVNGNDVYMVQNNNQSEHWTKDLSKWKTI